MTEPVTISTDRPGRPWLAALVSTVVLASACATAPSAVFQMSQDQLMVLEREPLCYALASARRDREPRAAIEAEAARRGETCELEIARTTSDCSSLQVTNTERVAQGTIVSVRNTGRYPRNFRVAVNGIASTLQRVEPGQTHSFGIATSPLLAAAGAAVASAQGAMGVSLGDCRVPW